MVAVVRTLAHDHDTYGFFPCHLILVQLVSLCISHSHQIIVEITSAYRANLLITGLAMLQLNFFSDFIEKLLNGHFNEARNRSTLAQRVISESLRLEVFCDVLVFINLLLFLDALLPY